MFLWLLQNTNNLYKPKKIVFTGRNEKTSQTLDRSLKRNAPEWYDEPCGVQDREGKESH